MYGFSVNDLDAGPLASESGEVVRVDYHAHPEYSRVPEPFKLHVTGWID